MRGNEFLDKLELIDPDFIEAADVATGAKRMSPVKKLLIAAACFIFAVSLGFGGYAYAAEVKEYNDAVRFFDQYALSTDGLSREDIKEVYKDISTNSFTDDKTVYVIVSNCSPDILSNYTAPDENSPPEDVEEFWNCRNSMLYLPSDGQASKETTPQRESCGDRHKYEYSITNEGSCTEEKTIMYACIYCGYSKQETTTGKVHSFGEYSVTVEATCTTLGKKTAECTLCGAKDEKYIPAGHMFNEENSYIVEESTCMKKGSVKYECTVCGETITERLPLIAHDWDITVQEAACTKNGFKTGVCQGCGEKRRFEEYFRLGHDYKLQGDGDFHCTRCDYLHSEMYWHEVQKTVQKRATCTKEGLVYAECLTCGISGESVTPKALHDYEQTILVYPDCLNEGYKQETCIHCGYLHLTEYQKTNHSFKKIDGMAEKYKCAVCGLEIDGPAIDEISVDGEKDETYCYYAFKRVSHGDIYAENQNVSADVANGDFEAYIALGEKGMYIYAEIKDSTPTDALGEGCGDYIKLYLDWCTYDIIHPYESEKKKMENLGQPWDPIKDYRDKYGVVGLQYLGWLQGYSNGEFDGGLGFAPVDSLGPDASCSVIYKVKVTDGGWACEWFIPWRDDDQKRMVAEKEQFHMGLGIEVGDDTLVNDEKANATVKRFDQNKDYGIRYSEDYSLLADIYLINLWIYLPRQG